MYNMWKNNIASYDVSICSWLDLLQLVWIWIGLIPGAAECDFDVCKNVYAGLPTFLT